MGYESLGSLLVTSYNRFGTSLLMPDLQQRVLALWG